MTVTLSEDPERRVVIQVAHTPQGGATPDDYSMYRTGVGFDSGKTTNSFTVGANVDDVDDDGESVNLTFTSLPPGVTAGSVASSTVNITDDDTAGITVSKTTLTVDEGGSETYTVKLDTEPSDDVTVEIGGESGDISANPTSLTFTSSSWNTPQTVTLSAAEDLDAVDDRVALTHSASGGGYGSVTVTLAVTIADNDTPGVTVSPTELHISEGNSGQFSIVLATEPSETVTVTIGGHTGTDLSVPNTSLTFTTDDWNTPQTVTVSADEDVDAVPDDEVTLSHTLSGGDYAGVTADSVTVTIYENDPVIPPGEGPPNRIITYPPPAGVTVNPLELTISEGESGTYSVGLDAEPSSSVTVKVTVPEGADLTVSPDTLEFTGENWEDAQTVTVSTTEDDDAVSDGVGISHDITGGGYSITGAATVAVTIDDNDSASVTISPTELAVDEGGRATYTVVLDTEPSADVTVTIGGASGDVSTDLRTLTFTTDNWSAAQTVTVSAAEDDDAVADAAVMLTHTVSGGDYGSVTADSVTVTVTENDSPTLAVGDAEASEADGTVDFEVTLSTASSNEVTVDYATSDGTAAAGSDYTATTGTLTFTVGSSASQTISVPVTDDSVDEAETETFTLTLSGAVNASLAGGDDTLAVTGTISDDDDPQVTVSFEQSTYSVAEGGTVEVTVTLDKDPERTVSIPLTTTEQDGATSADYSGVPATSASVAGTRRRASASAPRPTTWTMTGRA